MKIHRLVQMLGLINESGRLASDMYDLNDKEYYSKAEDKFIPISHMDFQHLIRAFVKFCSQDQDLTIARCDTQAKTIADYIDKVEQLEDIIDEKDRIIQKMLDKPTWTEQPTNGHRYVFSEIPNDEYGKKLARGMKMYLNDESYTMRVRGQHLKPELYGTGKASFGQSIEDSTHLRIYIDKKKGE